MTRAHVVPTFGFVLKKKQRLYKSQLNIVLIQWKHGSAAVCPETTSPDTGQSPQQAAEEENYTHLYGDMFTDELDSVLLHVVSSTVGHVLVKPPQQDGAHHDGDIQPQAGQETTALQSHVGRPHNQGLPRAVRQREKVVTGKQSGRR